MCDATFNNRENNRSQVEQMQAHIVNNHFYARLTKLVSKYHRGTSQKCPFGPQCQTNIQNMANCDLILHVAIDHKLIDKFIQDLAKELKKFGSTFKTQSLKCPFRGKPGVVETAACHKDKTPFQLIQHVFVHCSDEVTGIVDELNKYIQGENLIIGGVPKTCPIEGCSLTFHARNHNELLSHVAIAHLGVLQFLCREFDRIKDEKSKQIFTKYLAGVTGDENVCQDCKKIFGSARELKLHRSRDHISAQLMAAFANSSKLDPGSNRKVCGLCTVSFSMKYDGGVHMGIMHEDATKIYVEKSQRFESRQEEAISA
jgi:hypothetical protein